MKLNTPASEPSPAAGGILTIDLGALVANWKALASRAASAECAAAVKGDGYGIGLEQAVKSLSEAGCRTFFVALPDEGVRARAVTESARIFVLGGFMPDTGTTLREHNLIPVLNSTEEIEDWQAIARRAGTRLEAAIHVDTGMNRLGLREVEANALVADPKRMEDIEPVLIMSHLACGSDPAHSLNERQRSAFERVRPLFPGCPGSLANSAGIFLGSGYHHDLVRPGIALYGGAALDSHLNDNPMCSVVEAKARVLQVRTVPAGEGIGYGSAETAKRDSRIAITAVGYADGYHRRAGSSDARSGAAGIFNGARLPLIGRVSMDLTAFDVTDCPEPGPKRGDWITILGGAAGLTEVAVAAETIDYELLTGLGRRYERVYR
ncbi:MAG: alanine racemase [Pseudomonadota bacterium]